MDVPAAQTGAAAYRAALAPHRRNLLEDELKRRKSGETLALLQRLLQESSGDGELHYFMGETYRIRNADGDTTLALDAYRSAIGKPKAPPETYRSMGMVYQHEGDAAAARAAFQRYLSAKPDAPDAEMIKVYVKEGTAP
jgi:regulator of sirC expression with transglutaminase-like and TPR domain